MSQRIQQPIVIEGNHEATHYANLYRDAHNRAEVLGRRYTRMLTGVEAGLTTIPDRQSPSYVLLESVVAASRWDGEIV
jgi:hypothetical protein